jgi:carbamoyl-phosphate synthase large subunit
MDSGNILISSAGRRVGLLTCFRESIASRGRSSAVLTIDCASTAPTRFTADHAISVPRCTDAAFLDTVHELCRKYHATLVVPTIDTELSIYAAAREQFAADGITIAISSPAAVRICGNKIGTHDWLTANGFPTVRQTDLESALCRRTDWPLPLIVKPYNGSASIGLRRVTSELELDFLAATTSGCIVQEAAAGREFTINCYVNRAGQCICTVPHWRMEVRSGEVSKGITLKDRRLMELARSVAEALPGAYGPLNIQCFLDDSGATRIIEINARFGGGYPLAHRAGAQFTAWLLDELEGSLSDHYDGWTDDLAMLRFDEAVYVPGSRLLI